MIDTLTIIAVLYLIIGSVVFFQSVRRRIGKV